MTRHAEPRRPSVADAGGTQKGPNGYVRRQMNFLVFLIAITAVGFLVFPYLAWGAYSISLSPPTESAWTGAGVAVGVFGIAPLVVAIRRRHRHPEYLLAAVPLSLLALRFGVVLLSERSIHQQVIGTVLVLAVAWLALVWWLMRPARPTVETKLGGALTTAGSLMIGAAVALVLVLGLSNLSFEFFSDRMGKLLTQSCGSVLSPQLIGYYSVPSQCIALFDRQLFLMFAIGVPTVIFGVGLAIAGRRVTRAADLVVGAR